MRLDRCPVLPYLDDDGRVRPARLLARSGDRVCVMVTRALGATHVLWRPAARLEREPPASAAVALPGR